MVDAVDLLIAVPETLVYAAHLLRQAVDGGIAESDRAQALSQVSDRDLAQFDGALPQLGRYGRGVRNVEPGLGVDGRLRRRLQQLEDLACDNTAHLPVLEPPPPEREPPEADVARLVSGHGREAGGEARHQSSASEVAQEVALAGQGEVALDDQVVGDDRLHPGPPVCRLAAHQVGGVGPGGLEYAAEGGGGLGAPLLPR